ADRAAGERGQRAAEAAYRLPDAVLVLDEREADVALPALAEAGARADGDERVARQEQRELVGAESRVRLGDRRPDEHRPLGRLDVPADPREPRAERVPAARVD